MVAAAKHTLSVNRVLEAAVASAAAATEASRAATKAAEAAIMSVQAADKLEKQLAGVDMRLRRVEEYRELNDARVDRLEKAFTKIEKSIEGIADGLGKVFTIINTGKMGGRMLEWTAAIALGAAAIFEILRHTT